MIQKFLKIRFIQIKRSLQDLSIGHGIGLILIVFFLGITLFPKFFQDKNSPWIFAGIVAIGITYLHLNRPDKRLISIVGAHPHPHRRCRLSIFMAEYLTLVLPVFLILIFTKNYLIGFVLFFVILCISLTSNILRENKGTSLFSKYLPTSAFEWRGGMRKGGIALALFYVLALAFSWVRIAPFVLLFFGLTVIVQFFNECEPLSILTLSEDKTLVFLKKKIAQSLLIYSVLTLPIVALSMIFVSDLWYVGVIFYLVACVNIVNFIFTKYAFYHPNSHLGAGSLLTQLSLLGSIIPFLLPLPFFLVLWHYIKAKQKLQYYLG